MELSHLRPQKQLAGIEELEKIAANSGLSPSMMTDELLLQMASAIRQFEELTAQGVDNITLEGPVLAVCSLIPEELRKNAATKHNFHKKIEVLLQVYTYHLEIEIIRRITGHGLQTDVHALSSRLRECFRRGKA